MYQYDAYDHRLVADRVAQFRDQVRRRISGELTEEEFLPLRLQNGLYYQRHAYMLRVAIPYGHLRAKQLRMLSHIAAEHDRGYGHFSTRQNIQYNWIELEQVPDILAKLASVEMHAIQTSGNCIRNITTDQFAGVAPDEVIDARPLAEILRQWSTFIPEFAFLPRKFKIAVSASRDDRAVTQLHDIGVYAYEKDGQTLLRILAGGGMGRTPILGAIIKEDLPWQHMLSYIEAAVRVYNRYGRRDNKYKARIKILVKAIGAEEFARQVEEEWQHIKDGPSTITQAEFDRVAQFFAPPAYEKLADTDAAYEKALLENKAFARWVSRNVHPHRVPGYAAVTLSLKPGAALPPGDATAEQMDAIADLADRYSFGEIRVGHEQNLALPHVAQRDLPALWRALDKIGVATPNVNLVSDIIA